MRLSHRVDGLEELDAALAGLAGAVGDSFQTRGLMEDFGLIVESRVANCFRQQRAPEHVPDTGKATSAAGKPWKALAKSTVAGRRKGGGGAKILIDTGDLRGSVGKDIGDDYAEVGTGLNIGLYHMGGTRPYTIVPKEQDALRFVGPAGELVFAKKVNHPGLDPRPFIGVDDEDITHMLSRTLLYLRRAAG